MYGLVNFLLAGGLFYYYLKRRHTPKAEYLLYAAMANVVLCMLQVFIEVMK